MNRKERRAAEKMQKKGMHPNQSFSQLVGEANREALKPFIQEQVINAARIIQANLARQQLESLAGVQTRIVALEKIVKEKLGYTDDQLAELILVVEDEATGHTENTEGARQGDLVRVRIAGRPVSSDPSKDQGFGPETKLSIHHLGNEPTQTNPDLEKGMLGMKKGETKEIEVDFPQKDEQGNEKEPIKYLFKVTVDRASTPPAKAEAPTQEAAPQAGNA